MSSFFGISRPQSAPSSNSLNSNHHDHGKNAYIQPEDDDIWSHREIEEQRIKWRAFLKSRQENFNMTFLCSKQINWFTYRFLEETFGLKNGCGKIGSCILRTLQILLLKGSWWKYLTQKLKRGKDWKSWFVEEYRQSFEVFAWKVVFLS